jgi:hypothetical protein
VTALHFGPGGTRAAMSPAASGPSSSPSCLRPGLPAELADALDDTSFDAELRREADEALALTGKDVGTPIIHFQSPDGVGFFGPVVSRLPSEAEAVPLWDNVLGPGQLPGLRRAQTPRARAAAATQLRRGTRPGRRPGGLVHRPPAAPRDSGASNAVWDEACQAPAMKAAALPRQRGPDPDVLGSA